MKQNKSRLIHVRLTDSEYAALVAFVDADPDLEGDKSRGVRKLIRTLPSAAATPTAYGKKEKAK